MGTKKPIPIRGIKQDWYGNKELEILKNNKEYARKSINNNLFGSPSFEEFSRFLVKPKKRNISRRRQGSGKKSARKRYSL